MSRVGRFGKTEAMRLAQVEREQRINRFGFMCHLSARGPQLVDPDVHGAVIADEMLVAALQAQSANQRIWTPA